MTDNRLVSTGKLEAVACCGRQGQLFWGVLLVILGGLLLMGTLVPLAWLGRYIFPVLLILWGGWKLWIAAQVLPGQ